MNSVPSTEEAETEGWQDLGQPEVHNKTLSKKRKGRRGRRLERGREEKKESLLNDSIKCKQFMNSI